MINLENINKLADGDEKLKDKLLTTFFQTTREDLQSLNEAVRNHQSSLVASLAHRIKGGAAVLGATKLVSLANSMEKAVQQGDLYGYGVVFDKLQNHFKSIEDLFPEL